MEFSNYTQDPEKLLHQNRELLRTIEEAAEAAQSYVMNAEGIANEYTYRASMEAQKESESPAAYVASPHHFEAEFKAIQLAKAANALAAAKAQLAHQMQSVVELEESLQAMFPSSRSEKPQLPQEQILPKESVAHSCLQHLDQGCRCHICGKKQHKLESTDKGSGIGLVMDFCTRCGAYEKYYAETGSVVETSKDF